MECTSKEARAPDLDLWELTPVFLEDVRNAREVTANTLDAYARDMRHILKALAEPQPTVPVFYWKTERLMAVIDGMTRKGYSPRSIERMLCTWRQFSQFLIRRGLIEHNPLKRIAAPAFELKQPRPMQRAIVLRALEHLDAADERDRRDRLILELLCGCGIRVAELAELSTSDVDTWAGVLHVRSGLAPRDVPLPARVLEACYAYLRASNRSLSEPATPLMLGMGRTAISQRTVQRIVELRIAELVGEERVTPRHLRQAFVFWMLEAGHSMVEVSRMTGHLRLATTQRYAEQLAVWRAEARLVRL